MIQKKDNNAKLKAEIMAEVRGEWAKLKTPEEEKPQRPRRYRLEIIIKCTDCRLCKETGAEKYHCPPGPVYPGTSLSYMKAWPTKVRGCFHPSFTKDGYPHRVISDHNDRPPDWCPLPVLEK